jgi:integrase
MGSITEKTKVTKEGKTVTEFRAFIRRKGFQQKSATFASKREAQTWLRNNEADSTLKTVSQGKTLGVLLDDFVDLAGCNYARMPHLDFWREQFKDTKVSDITHGDIAGAVLILRRKSALRSSPAGNIETDRKLSGSTINRYLATLSAVFSFALQHGLIDTHPMKGGKVKKLQENDGRQRTLTEAEETRLLDAAKLSEWPMMWLYLRMLLTTGARRSEVNFLKWEHVRLQDKVAILPKTKNGNPRALPLVSDVREALAAASKVKPLHSDYVFYDPRDPANPKPVESAWKACRKAAGLEGQSVVIHTTRHTAVTKLVKGGANLAQVAAVSGHKTLAMLKRYEHLASQDAVELAERLLSGEKK